MRLRILVVIGQLATGSRAVLLWNQILTATGSLNTLAFLTPKVSLGVYQIGGWLAVLLLYLAVRDLVREPASS